MGNGVMTCRTVACTATSCTGGEICCTGQGGALAACQAGPICPGNVLQICATNADCPTGMVCRTNNGGNNGALNCRAPLPEAGPPDAGSVDATMADAERPDTGSAPDATATDAAPDSD
jgi:Cys-rich repeat protein